MLVNSKDLVWTRHSEEKMLQYGLSKSRVLRVLRHPDRIEEGIVPETVAVMQKAGSKKRPYEIWVMYQIKSSDSKIKKTKALKLKIISTWKYPGRSPKGKVIYIPPDTLEFLNFSQNSSLV